MDEGILESKMAVSRMEVMGAVVSDRGAAPCDWSFGWRPLTSGSAGVVQGGG